VLQLSKKRVLFSLMKKSQSLYTRLLTKAALDLKIPYKIHDEIGDVVSFDFTKDRFFVITTTPFNDSSIMKICRDKDFSYDLFNQSIIMPKTIGFLDPEYKGKFKRGKVHKNNSEIANHIEKEFSYPLVIKMNSGDQGKNVYVCKDRKKVMYALSKIFNKKRKDYDYIAIAQEYLKIKSEFRAVFLDKKLILLYEKNTDKVQKTTKISPLHQKGSRAIWITDSKIQNKFIEFSKKFLNDFKSLRYTGLDIVVTKDNKMFLIEANTQLGFSYFVAHNGEEPLVEMYKKVIKTLKKDSEK
jgi:glutathione synthase/RimK-type ligase-like ATP-grasp enzyme